MSDENDWIDADTILDEFDGWKADDLADEVRRLRLRRDRNAAKLAILPKLRQAIDDYRSLVIPCTRHEDLYLETRNRLNAILAELETLDERKE